MSKEERKLQAKLLLIYLKFIQVGKEVYWVQTKHLADYMYGPSIGKVFHKYKMRIKRLLKPFILDGTVETTYKRTKGIGNSTGKSLVKYYHRGG